MQYGSTADSREGDAMRKTKKKQLFAALLSSALIVSNIAAAFPQTTVFASEGGEAVNGETTAEVAEEPAPSAVQETPAAEPAAEPVEVQETAPAEISVPEGTSSDNAAEAASGTTGTEAEGTGESTVPEVSSEAAAAVSSEAAVLTEETAPSLTILFFIKRVKEEALQSARSLSLPHILQMVQFRPARKQFRRKDFNLSTGPRPMSRL